MNSVAGYTALPHLGCSTICGQAGHTQGQGGLSGESCSCYSTLLHLFQPARVVHMTLLQAHHALHSSGMPQPRRYCGLHRGHVTVCLQDLETIQLLGGGGAARGSRTLQQPALAVL